MRKIGYIVMFLVLLAGCEEDEIWQPMSEQEREQEIIYFVEDYKETWEESLASQTFSLMESYFVPNSHVYHMERRQHQQLTGQRSVESFENFSGVVVEENQYDEYRLRWQETILIENTGISEEQTRMRQYYISEGSAGYRITAIERADEIE